jgi:DNA polymerase-3 subunit chi
VTKVDFYTGSTDKLRTACQLCHKALQGGIRVMLSVPDTVSSHMLDKLMWEYPSSAFIPHCLSNHADAEAMPVVIYQGEHNFLDYALLISLHTQPVNFFSRFERVIEIVSTSEEDSRLGRERFKFYRDRGYELRHFDLSKTPSH